MKKRHLKQMLGIFLNLNFTLDMFPYPSGQGLHVGHPEGYTATDIISQV